MVIDFRLRPPFGGYLKTGMYSDKSAADFYADNIGMKRSESAKQESMELLLQEMEENGIDMGVAIGRLGHKKGDVSNDEVIRLAKQYPQKFIGLAGLNAADIQGSIQELHRVCVNGPLKGAVLEPGAMKNPLYADDKTLYPIYEECQKHQIPVMLMIGGRAGPNQTYSNPQIISRLAFDFPETNFIVSHGGWPFVQEILGICFYQKNIYLSPDLYFFNLPGQDDYIRAVSCYMQDRFLFGSAYPFLPLSCIQEFKKAFPQHILEKVLYGNAKKLLKL